MLCVCALQIHRAFIDDADDTQTLPGVYIIEWTLLGRIFFFGTIDWTQIKYGHCCESTERTVGTLETDEQSEIGRFLKTWDPQNASLPHKG